jgi:hypothetical protein
MLEVCILLIIKILQRVTDLEPLRVDGDDGLEQVAVQLDTPVQGPLLLATVLEFYTNTQNAMLS